MAEHEEHHGADHKHDHGEEHHAPPGVGQYLVVFGLLCVLTLCSILIAAFLMETPSIAWTGMMAVSCGKAMLVIMFFMHLKWEANWKYVLTVPATVMSVLIALALVPDIALRTWKYSQSRWLHAAEGSDHSEVSSGADETDAAGEGDH